MLKELLEESRIKMEIDTNNRICTGICNEIAYKQPLFCSDCPEYKYNKNMRKEFVNENIE